MFDDFSVIVQRFLNEREPRKNGARAGGGSIVCPDDASGRSNQKEKRMKFPVVLALQCWATLAIASPNLLELTDLSQADKDGLPAGYIASVYVPGHGRERASGKEFVRHLNGAVELQLPEGRNFDLDLAKGVDLADGKSYLFEVNVKWEDLASTGPGLPPFGP